MTLLTGALVVGSLAAVAIVSLFWTPLSPSKMQIVHKLQPPLSFGLLGTDQFGRDVLSMLVAGSWNSLSIAVTAVAIGGAIGSVAGSMRRC
jgi:peptide/nickel transport system permease protein